MEKTVALRQKKLKMMGEEAVMKVSTKHNEIPEHEYLKFLNCGGL